MLEIIVVLIPETKFLFKISFGSEGVLLIQLLFVFTMRTFNCSILGWFPRINQVVDDVVFPKPTIECVYLLNGQVTAFVGANIIVREGAVIVGLDSLYGIWKSFLNYFHHSDGMIRSLFIKHFQVPPSACSVYDGVLVVFEASDSPRNILHVHFHEFTESLPADEVEILKNIDFHYHGKDEERFPRSLLEYSNDSETMISNFGGRGHLECRDESKYDFYSWFSACDSFFKRIYSSKEPLMSHYYKKYDTLVFDNHRYLHGRENKESAVDKQRTLNRIWLDFT